MPRVVHFEIPADNVQRAAEFYSATFGWDIGKWKGSNEEYWLVTTGSDDEPGIDGAIQRRKSGGGKKPAGGFVCTVDVPSVDEFVGKVKENGGGIVTPKTAVPAVGWIAYCTDTEGNMLGLMEGDPGAE